MADEETHELDHFSGGVPAFAMFSMILADLRDAVEATPEQEQGYVHSISEVSFIGLAAYFEAFCKDHFASLINICPQLISRLEEQNYDVTINSNHLLTPGTDPLRRIGFFLSEKYNFGTAKQINSLYSGLIGITPFSRDQRQTYDKLLDDRNLIVHHGGVYTTKYIKQRFSSEFPERSQDAFLHSLVVDNEMFRSSSSFLLDIAEKVSRTSQRTLVEYIETNSLQLTEEKQKAIECLTWDL